MYVPQLGLDDKVKDAFYDDLLSVVSEVSDQDILIPCGDWNGHIGRDSAGFHGIHGGYGFGEHNPEGVRILEFAVAQWPGCWKLFLHEDDHIPVREQQESDRLHLAQKTLFQTGEGCQGNPR